MFLGCFMDDFICIKSVLREKDSLHRKVAYMYVACCVIMPSAILSKRYLLDQPLALINNKYLRVHHAHLFSQSDDSTVQAPKDQIQAKIL
jgi:hypothetical protein